MSWCGVCRCVWWCVERRGRGRGRATTTMSKVAIFDRSARPGAKKKDERRGRRRTGVGGGGGGRYEEGTKTNKGKFRNQFGEGYTVTGRRLAPEIVFDPKSRAYVSVLRSLAGDAPGAHVG